MALRRADAEAVAAARALLQRPRRMLDLGAERNRLRVQSIDRARSGAERCTPSNAARGRSRERQHMMVAAGAAQVQRVALAGDILQRPDLAVELGRFLEIVDGQFDAAQAVDPGGAHGCRLHEAGQSGAYMHRAGGSADVGQHFTANPRGRRADLAAHAFLTSATAGCFSTPEGANSQFRAGLNRLDSGSGRRRGRRGRRRMAEKFVAKSSEFKDGDRRIVFVGDHEIGVFRHEGQYLRLQQFLPAPGRPGLRGPDHRRGRGAAAPRQDLARASTSPKPRCTSSAPGTAWNTT